MKNTRSLLLAFVAILCGSNVSAQSLRIFKTDGSSITVSYAELDSIVAVNHEEQSKYQFIDLGLSVKWATFNVGAQKPEETGSYFSWGEITTKSTYIDKNSLTYEIPMEDISGNPEYDAARAIWGGSARMPTKAELEELVANCKWETKVQNGVKGMLVTGPNGNKIFLPAAGTIYESTVGYPGEFGSYWSSTPYEEKNVGAYSVDFYTATVEYNLWWGYRILGHTIRPVID